MMFAFQYFVYRSLLVVKMNYMQFSV